MTYNVCGGTLNLAQSINQACVARTTVNSFCSKWECVLAMAAYFWQLTNQLIVKNFNHLVFICLITFLNTFVHLMPKSSRFSKREF